MRVFYFSYCFHFLPQSFCPYFLFLSVLTIKNISNSLHLRGEKMKLKNLPVVIVLLWSFTGFASNVPIEPELWPNTPDLDFENNSLEKEGWSVGGDYKIEIDNTEAFKGTKSLRFTSLEGANTTLPGFAAARLPVPQFRGKRIRLSGALKTANASAPFSLWLRADAGQDPATFNQLRRNIPNGTTPWKQYSVELDIPLVATAVFFGIVFYGEGTAWVDDLSIEVLPLKSSNSPLLAGTVSDTHKKPVPNALIAAKAMFHETALACTSSDENGKFRFHLPPGTYMLSASTTNLTAAVLPSRDYSHDVEDLILTVGAGDGFTINGTIQAPPRRLTAGSYVVVNRLESIDSTIFYAPLAQDGSFRVTVPTGAAYRIDLDSPPLKVVPVMIDQVAAAGETRRCELQAVVPQPAPEPVVSWMKDNAVRIQTLEAGHEFTDLQPLRKNIGSARVVAMGEATHGSREFFQARHRFLEYLVEEMGFSVLALEGLDIQSTQINDYILEGKGNLVNAVGASHPFLCTEEGIAMIQWLRNYNADPSHAKKVKIYGIEVGESRNAAIFLEKYLEKTDPVTARDFEKKLSWLKKPDVYARLMNYSAEESTALLQVLNGFLSRFDREKDAYSSKSLPKEWERARHSARELQQFVETIVLPGNNDYHYLNLRAKFMAESIGWILETQPPGTKVVLMAHNFHISLSPYPGYPFEFMGMHLRRMLGNDYLSIGFVFNYGSFQGLDYTSPNPEQSVLKSFTVGPYVGSYGTAMARTGFPFFFLDLRSIPASGPVHDWFSAPQVCKWINYVYDSEKDIRYLFRLPLLFDSIIFVDKTSRARAIPAGRQPSFPY